MELIALVTGILKAAPLVVTAASAIANLTPSNHDNEIVAKIGSVVNLFALNWRGETQPRQSTPELDR